MKRLKTALENKHYLMYTYKRTPAKLGCTPVPRQKCNKRGDYTKKQTN